MILPLLVIMLDELSLWETVDFLVAIPTVKTAKSNLTVHHGTCDAHHYIPLNPN